MSTKPISNFTASWNQNKIYNGIGMNAVDTAANAQSKLINLYHNNVSKFNVDKNGNIVATGNISGSKFTASRAHIGGVPSTSQYKFYDNSLPDLYSNKIRGYSGSFTYLELISGSAPRAILPVIDKVNKITGEWNDLQVDQGISFSTTGNDIKPRINIIADGGAVGGTINVNAVDLNLGGMINQTIDFGPTWNSGPNNERHAIEISGSHISFNPLDPNECIDINGCLNISGNLNIGGNFKIGSNSLYLSSSNSSSRIHGTNLTISSSVISASRMHVGGKTKTTQYKFYDGSKPDLYVNKLRAYSGSFTSLEIISGSEGSMSIKNDKGNVIFSARQNGTKDEVSIFNNIGKFLKEKDPVTGKDNTDFIFGVAGSGKNSVKFDYTDVVMGMSSSISGNLAVKGGWSVSITAVDLLGKFYGTGSVQIGTTINGQVQGLVLDKIKMSVTDVSSNYKNVDAKIEASVSTITDGTTNYFGTHSIEIKNAAVVKIDGTNAPINLRKQVDGSLFLELGRTLIKTGTQSLYITGSTISGSELNLYFPDNKSKLNVYHITGSSGKYNKLTATNIFGMVTGSISGSKGTFNSFNFNAISASSIITSSTAGSSSGKFAKIKIGNQTYKILLYADS